MHLLLAQTGADGGSLLGFLPLLLIGAFIWFAMIRPQRKRQQAVQSMQKQLSVGDDVVTIGGLHGRVDAIGEATVDLELTDDVIVRFKRSAIAEIVSESPADEDGAADDADDAEPAESAE